MRIDVQTPRTSYGILAAIGVALALAIFVWLAGASRGWAHTSSASNALSPKQAKADTTAIDQELAMESAVFGPEHAAEHAALYRAELKWAELGHQPHQNNPKEALSSEAATLAAPAASPSQVGEWTQAPFQLPTFAINTTVLPTGKVLIWGRPPIPGNGSPRPNVGQAALWSPWLGTGSNAFQQVTPPVIDVDGPGGQSPVPAPFWCSGLSQLANGDVLVAGGNLIYGNTFPNDAYTTFAGLNTIFTFDPFSQTWIRQPDMANGRWYPNQLLLPDGRTIISGGLSDVPPGGVQNNTLEIFNPPSTLGGQGTVDENPGANKNFGLYPRTFTLNSGNALFAGPQSLHTWKLDTSNFTWTGYPHMTRNRQYGNAVRVPGGPSGSDTFTELGGYDTAPPPGGGSFHPATATTETTNSDVTAPSWTPGASWNVARANSNTVLLPDGSMVTVGGGSGFDDSKGIAAGGYVTYADGRARQVELYDPKTNSWTLGPAQQEDRAYHSTAVLLPDGRVFSGGDDLHPLEANGIDSQTDNGEIYSPPYLFKGSRPQIDSAPQTIRWGDAFGIHTASPNIDKAVLMAPGATTHGFDTSQRNVDLKVLDKVGGQGVDVVSPPSANVAPPGYYMLFLINDSGVPSVASWVRIDPSAPDRPTIGAPPTGDFNGDGFPDLAVGAPGEDVGSATDAGAVNVIYGSGGGLTATGNQAITQNDVGAGETAASGNRFGTAVTVGDFNHDGFADLAVGAPGENAGSANDAGAVDVLYGSPNGLSASGAQVLAQGGAGIQGTPEAGDRFGAALAAGDLNGDGRDDLAVGVPSEAIGTTSAGVVNMIYGSAAGLSSTGNQLWSQDSAGIAEVAEAGDSFGAALAAGDLNGDGRDDLAVGVPSETIGTTSAGAVNMIYGSAAGLSSTGNQLWSQNSTGIADAAEAGDRFGSALAAGDLNGDGRDDLAVGVPSETIGTTSAGAVNMIYGSAAGLSSTGNQLWSQNSTDIKDAAEAGDRFGSALAAGDLNGDGEADLAIGVPGESVGTIPSGGAVNAIYGSAGGLTSTGNQVWTQNSAGVLDSAEAADSFGAALAAGDVDRDGHADVAIGVPIESVGTAASAGALNTLYGSASGLTSTGNQLWSQDTPNVLDQAEAADQFGAAMGLLAG